MTKRHTAAAEYLRRQDAKLAAVIKQVGPVRLKRQHKLSPYESLLESIVYQQLTGKAAATIYGRLQAFFSKDRAPLPEEILKASEQDLRSVGLSRMKILAMKDLAQKTLDGLVPDHKTILKLKDAEIIERLTEIRGIGQWTVEMLLIFKLGRPDILPIHDYGVRKGFMYAYGKKEMPTPKQLLAFGERWKPHRTVAAWYLWRAVDLQKSKPKKRVLKSKSG